jgi:fructose-bisphosphate aldolase class I
VTSILGTAAQLVAPGRGILAADESPSTMSKRLEAAGTLASADTRRAYRELLLTSPAISRWVSGVILSDETFGQQLSDGRPFPTGCHDLGILPSIKVDNGTAPLALVPGATVTEGLDGLRQRLSRYAKQGPASPSGGPCSVWAAPRGATPPSRPTPRPWGGTPHCARRPVSSRSWSPRC